VADPEFVGLFAVPGEGLLRPGNLVAQAVLPPGGRLGNPQRTAGTPLETEQHRGTVVGGDRDFLGVALWTGLAGEGFDFALGALAHPVDGFQVRENGLHFQARNRGNQIHPMGPDVRHGAKLAATIPCSAG